MGRNLRAIVRALRMDIVIRPGAEIEATPLRN